LVLVGCEAEPPQLAPVHGNVYFKKAPLGGGIIVFTPDAVRNGDGPISHAEIQPDGSYVLSSDRGMGAVPGWHLVTITAFGEGASPLPDRYGDPEQSGLSFEIKPGQDNRIDVNLE
jgi:hypothetical protein